MSIYYTILAQLLRFLLRFAAGYLAYIGLSSDKQNEFVEVTVGIIAPILLILIAEGWSYLRSRYFPVLLETALNARPTQDIESVKMQAKGKSNAPVIY